jgi:eukaryotic-like serine/threonine-protein kinase
MAASSGCVWGRSCQQLHGEDVVERDAESHESFVPGDVMSQRYVLHDVIAAGGMATVWFATHATLHSALAIKVMRRDALLDDFSGHLLREARITSSLRSAHIVRVHDFGFDRGRAYMAMEYLEGESLAARLQRCKRLGLAATSRVITDLARGLDCAHGVGVVHRDVKPENAFIVMTGKPETVKLLDFGVAQAKEGRSDKTRGGALMGTPLYMSPEQASRNGAVDLRSDVWGLGVVAFECLVGQPPFLGDTLGAVLSQITSGRRLVPSSRGCSIPGFDGWFARACAHDPAQRFGSAGAAAEALERLARSQRPLEIAARVAYAPADLAEI